MEFKKKIHKREFLESIFERYNIFYNNSKKSKNYIFSKPIKIENDYIVIEYINFKEYKIFHSYINNTQKIIFLTNTLIEFYKSNNNSLNGVINLHGDLHLGNIYYGNGKILFIDPETPNSGDYKIFIQNIIYFELSYLIYYLDNEKSLFSLKFYKLNIFFKKIFINELEKNLGNETLFLIIEGYKNHIIDNFKFSYNPIFFINRILRFVIIFIKYYIWRTTLMILLKK